MYLCLLQYGKLSSNGMDIFVLTPYLPNKINHLCPQNQSFVLVLEKLRWFMRMSLLWLAEWLKTLGGVLQPALTTLPGVGDLGKGRFDLIRCCFQIFLLFNLNFQLLCVKSSHLQICWTQELQLPAFIRLFWSIGWIHLTVSITSLCFSEQFWVTNPLYKTGSESKLTQ